MSELRVLIAGCGYVGLAAAQLFQRAGWNVVACTYSRGSAAALSAEPFGILTCDLTNRESVNSLAEHGPYRAIIHCASSGRGGAEQYRSVYLEGARNLAAALSPALLLFTGSTSVYAQTSGEWVTEQSQAEPSRETGRILRETEDFVLSQGGIATRLAGIYGPGRSVLLRKFLAGTAVIEGDGTRWINQIHRDDAAAALLMLCTRGEGGVFNVADDEPLAQRSLYEGMAAHFLRPLPPSGPIDTSRKRGWTHKRVSNARLRALGWQPAYASFFDALRRDPSLTPSE